ncbi:MAG: cupin domain-containing protein [Candidatus Merdivicinus sp.]|jgi:cupin 2 domain-containing protein
MNLLTVSNSPADEEICEILWQGRNVRVERILSAGQTSPSGFWYDQPETEWLTVLDGCGEVEMETGELHRLYKGDTLLIPAHARHRVSYTSTEPPCIWLCVFGEEASDADSGGR